MIFVDMDTADWVFHAIIGVMGLSSVVMMAIFGAAHMSERYLRIEASVDRVLNQQLLMEVPARLAIGVGILLILGFGMVCAVVLGSPLWFVIGVVFGALLPSTIINLLETRRRRRLDEQIVDGITTLASGVRAGLNLVQSFQLLATNSIGPLQQEVRQMMREYELGTDLNQAMRNASTRIGSSYYRLLFAAIEAHRQRGGDMSESLDRISESLRAKSAPSRRSP